MEAHSISAIQAIQAILAPALGISAVGLLLLGLSTRYSTIVNRIRLLTDEKRRFARQIAEKGELPYPDSSRFMSIRNQTGELLIRHRLVRNAILAMQAAIGLFVLASVLICLNLFVANGWVEVLPLMAFIVGMIALLIGVIFAALEVYRSSKIILIEVHAEE